MKTILATDSPKLNDFFAIYLIEEGIEPVKVNDAETLYNKVKMDGVDTVILDIDSKNFDGQESVTKLYEANENAKIIIFTTQTGVEFVKDISDNGVFGLISKIDDMNIQIQNLFSLLDTIKKRNNEKRKHIRIKPSESQHNVFFLRISGIESEYQGQVKDISRGGVALTFSNPPPESLLFKGKDVILSIELSSFTFDVQGTIVTRIGMDATILFINLTDSTKKKIFEYILSRIDEA